MTKCKTDIKILHLVLKREPFEVMVTGEKKNEYREPSDWIKSRLFDKEGNRRAYDFVCFRLGYRKFSPFFYVEYLGFTIANKTEYLKFTNKLHVKVNPGDYIIRLGEIKNHDEVIEIAKQKNNLIYE